MAISLNKLMKNVKKKKVNMGLTWKEVASVPEINTLSDLRLFLRKKELLAKDESLIDKLIKWSQS